MCNGLWAKAWSDARDKESAALIRKDTYGDPCTPTSKVISTRWAFRVTRNADNTVKFKMRLVAKGFMQRPGIDFTDTFSPVCSAKSINTILSISASEDYELRSYDVGAAYLEAPIDTTTFIRLPASHPTLPNAIVQLRKSLYGLASSGLNWNKTIHQHLLAYGFVRSVADPCIYIYTSPDSSDKIYIALYVDDFLTAGSNPLVLDNLETYLKSCVQELSTSTLAKFLGISITRNRDNRTISLHQPDYLKEITTDYPSLPGTLRNLPADPNVNLYIAERTGEPDLRGITGSGRWLADHTRPDIQFIVSQLGSAAANPGPAHTKASQYLVSYLTNTSDLTLTLGGRFPITLESYVDASYIEEGASRSQLGYCLRLNSTSGMLFSRSVRDTAVSLSSAEAELRALKELTQDIIWFRLLLHELGYTQPLPTPAYEDNSAVLTLVESVKTHPRSRHLNKIRNFIIQEITSLTLHVVKVPGTDNVADIFTKPLDKDLFTKHRSTLLGSHLVL